MKNILKKLLLKNLSISLYGLFILELLYFYPNKIFARDLDKKILKEISINYDQLGSSNVNVSSKISKSTGTSKIEIARDLKANGNKLLTLLAFEKNSSKINSFLDINSDFQYKEKDVFHAEGNAIIYFSDATLRGDLIKYDLQNKLLTVVGNVIFRKGEQYFQASKLYYDFKKDTGYIDAIYGVLNNKTFINDFEIGINKDNRNEITQKIQVSKPEYPDFSPLGLKDKFNADKTSNLKEVNLSRSIGKLRYKADKLIYKSETLKSKKILFTSDIYNDPQFVFLSKNFSAEIVDDRLKILSRNSWIILDNKLKFPVGRRTIFDREDTLTQSGFGADFKDKDGYYLFRSLYPRKIFKDYTLKIKPYFLIQRALRGSTNSFTEKNSSVFSEKVKNDINFSDYFAMDLTINREENNWDFESNVQLNSLNTERLGESLRTKIILSKRINLKEKFQEKKALLNDNNLSNFTSIEVVKDRSSIFDEQINPNDKQLHSVDNKKVSTNFLDLSFYNIFREQIIKDFGTEDIYFASGFNLSNKKAWTINDNNSTLNFIYDVGYFKSESNFEDEFQELFRNTFVADYNYQFPLWKKSYLDKQIDKSYKYSPVVISQSLNWSTGLQTALFLYSDDSSQSALKFNTGPVLTYGGLKDEFLDYTKLSAEYSYVFKGGESPFIFDDINDDPRIKFNLQQQIYGPLLFSYDTILNLNNGTYSNNKYSLDFKRRAYSIGAFYNSSNESLGIEFNIFNFDYSGFSKKF